MSPWMLCIKHGMYFTYDDKEGCLECKKEMNEACDVPKSDSSGENTSSDNL